LQRLHAYAYRPRHVIVRPPTFRYWPGGYL